MILYFSNFIIRRLLHRELTYRTISWQQFDLSDDKLATIFFIIKITMR